MSRRADADSRPLSPNIQIYRPQLTSVLSIANRITGIVLSVAAVVLVIGLVAVASGPEAYTRFQGFAGSWLGRLLMFAATFAFFLHLCGGIRHLYWDTARGLELGPVYTSGWLVVIASVVLTVLHILGLITAVIGASGRYWG